jgi:hypothetical protein
VLALAAGTALVAAASGRGPIPPSAGGALGLVLGVLAVIPIGGADMPVVISLLNSYSGLAACAAGFIIGNNVLIVAGCLVGASGIILTRIMCKAMNRSLAQRALQRLRRRPAPPAAARRQGRGPTDQRRDAYYLLESARSVVFVPGYGMAVAQAQHAVRELGDLLEANGCEVKYAIHPVAGRMPGHMNVLLAEANVPYEQLVEPAMSIPPWPPWTSPSSSAPTMSSIPPPATTPPARSTACRSSTSTRPAPASCSSAAWPPASPGWRIRSSSRKTPACSSATPRRVQHPAQRPFSAPRRKPGAGMGEPGKPGLFEG